MRVAGASCPQHPAAWRTSWPPWVKLKLGGRLWTELCLLQAVVCKPLLSNSISRRPAGVVQSERRPQRRIDSGMASRQRLRAMAPDDEDTADLNLIHRTLDDVPEEELVWSEPEQLEIEDDDDDDEDGEEAREWKYLPVMMSGSVSRIGDRENNEDARIVVDDLAADSRVGSLFSACGYHQGAFYAVIDGHGGDKASTFARKHLLRYVLEGTRSGDDPKAAIRAAFLRLDDDLRRRCGGGGGGKCSGAVAVVAMVLDGTLVVGNVGDCRAVVSERGKAVALTRAHRPSTARDERDRVLSSGTPISRRGYVGHAVAMTRALGDWDRPGLKRVGEDGENTGPVLAEPEFRSLELTQEHEFLVLGSDGLWDALPSSQRVVDMARRWLVQHGDPKKCAGQIAGKAIRAARKISRADNVTVIAVCFPSLQQQQRQHHPRGAAPSSQH